ncbi:ribonucleoside-diphosphate reductase subunit alpha [Rubeoparvulum massiliense]|uniref:ribonucleoside-diphosphate reductase subunit alpha n=1 Tax=Rubeoparvulum massiliense TaxID=1631346 RepID=UPI00069DB76A|nr:ribonucleoside-diphosphate reductase subunit alpha [Rubeoparvulum massiliense]
MQVMMGSRIEERFGQACEGLVTSDQREELLHQWQQEMNQNLSAEKQFQLLIRLAVERTSVEEPQWQWVAGRLYRQMLYGEVSQNRNLVNGEIYDHFPQFVHAMVDEGLYGTYLLECYGEEALFQLGEALKPERDQLFSYLGMKTLADRYLLRRNGEDLLELPQQLFMGVAMHLAMNEEEPVKWAKQFYDVLSLLELTVATPTLANARTTHPQLSSCFIDTVDDDLWSIYHADQQFSQVSKMGGGQGIYLGKVRAKGSSIRHVRGASGGVIPWVKNYNNTAIAVDQLGVRKGAVAIYLDIWHRDVLDFLQVRTNNGDDRMKAHDIFPAVSIPDSFMEQVEERGMWYLFDPYEVKKVMGYRLEDYYGEAFSKRYWDCVREERLTHYEIPAIEVMKLIMQSAYETGTPFCFFRDTVNRYNPNKHKGMIYSSNLCTEICQNMSPTTFQSLTVAGDEIMERRVSGDFVVCNLSSLNLGRVQTKEEIRRVVHLQMRMLDNVIDLNAYPVPEARITSERYRAVGLGTSGYHHFLATHGVDWESDEHLQSADQLYEWINYCAIEGSMLLAKERGVYPYYQGSDWESGEYFHLRQYDDAKWLDLQAEIGKYGVRNGYMLAIAPTSTTSYIAGTTAGIDPVFRRFFMEEKKDGTIPVTAPDLSPQNFWYYKEAHRIDQSYSIAAAARRQRHIDQAQSFNLYITPDITAKQFLSYYIEAWKQGLKTIYYVRSQSMEIEECVSCSS